MCDEENDFIEKMRKAMDSNTKERPLLLGYVEKKRLNETVKKVDQLLVSDISETNYLIHAGAWLVNHIIVRREYLSPPFSNNLPPSLISPL